MAHSIGTERARPLLVLVRGAVALGSGFTVRQRVSIDNVSDLGGCAKNSLAYGWVFRSGCVSVRACRQGKALGA
jgi:hypothetical protein